MYFCFCVAMCSQIALLNVPLYIFANIQKYNTESAIITACCQPLVFVSRIGRICIDGCRSVFFSLFFYVCFKLPTILHRCCQQFYIFFYLVWNAIWFTKTELNRRTGDVNISKANAKVKCFFLLFVPSFRSVWLQNFK